MQPSSTKPATTQRADVIIVGGGIAGLALALRLPSTARVILVTKQQLGESNTRYAQGGLAAAVGQLDSPASHATDTLVAGADHSDPAAVQVLAEGGRDAVAWLVAAGTQFDPAQHGAGLDGEATFGPTRLALGHEAAHSHHRILHAHGDATGAEIERAVVAAVRQRPHILVIEDALVTRLDMAQNTCSGISGLFRDGSAFTFTAPAVALANGGAGRLWRRTSNPPGATADGLALAWRAGAVLTDLEFVQFHPTVLVPPDPTMPAFLISEAVRGEGAYLRNQHGDRFMAETPGAELAPRDVVARAILLEMLREERDAVSLDLAHLDPEFVRHRFPTIAATCATMGIDITRDPIPVAPAAHYFMGGVAVDLDGRTTLPGLWAVGEVACTGVHGANRLASNSLLEGVIFGMRAALNIATYLSGNQHQHATTSWITQPRFHGEFLASPPLATPDQLDPTLATKIQTIMWERVSLFRDAQGLNRALQELSDIAHAPHANQRDTFAAFETANMALVGQLITRAAATRHESRGAHARRDYPLAATNLAGWRYFARLPQTATLLPTIAAPVDQEVAR